MRDGVREHQCAISEVNESRFAAPDEEERKAGSSALTRWVDCRIEWYEKYRDTEAQAALWSSCPCQVQVGARSLASAKTTLSRGKHKGQP